MLRKLLVRELLGLELDIINKFTKRNQETHMQCREE